MNNNPAVYQEARYEPAVVIPLKQEASLIDWLKANNRLIARETEEQDYSGEDPEIDELMGGEEDFEEDDFEDLEDS